MNSFFCRAPNNAYNMIRWKNRNENDENLKERIQREKIYK